MIETKNLGFGYTIPRRYREILRQPFRPRHPTLILSAVNLSIRRGVRLGIVGVNGSGKTTLLKLLGGMLYPSVGEVSIAGRDTVAHAIQLRSTIGYVINEDRSFDWMLTARDNLAFFAALNDIHAREAHTRIDWLCERLGLRSALDTLVSGYSSGMRQRLAIVRGLLHQPSVLLLDEPTRCLDPENAERVRNFLVDWSRAADDRILALTTNNPADAAAVCTECLRITAGCVSLQPLVPSDSTPAHHDFSAHSLESHLPGE